MTNWILNPAFNYVLDDTKGIGYVVSASGGSVVVNRVAMGLLGRPADEWRFSPDNTGFFESAVQARWLIEAADRPGLVRRVDHAPHLKRLHWEINRACNLRCQHCYCRSGPDSPQGEPLEFLVDVVHQARDLGVLFVDVTGGEPLVRRDLFKLLEELRRCGIRASIFTNATLVDDECAAALKECGVYSVQVSLDALTPALFDSFRGMRGAFTRTVAGIERLRDHGLSVLVSVTACKLTVPEIPALLAFIKNDLGVRSRLDRVIPAGRCLDEDVSVSNAEFFRLIREISSKEGTVLSMICSSPADILDEHLSPSCGVGADYAFIRHDGTVALCPTLGSEQSADFIEGNLHEQSLRKIWLEHPTFVKHRHANCEYLRKCAAARACRGGCRSNAFLLHGSVRAADEMACNLHWNEGERYRGYITTGRLE